MAKKLFIYILIASFVVGLALPVCAASSDVPDKSWKITMRAHVLYNGGDYLTVYLKSPKNMETQKDVDAYRIITLPVTEKSKAVDSKGKEMKISGLLSGQEVKVTFRYYVKKTETPWTSIPSGETRVHVSYSYEVAEFLKAELIGETIKLKSKAALDKLEPNTMLGTIITVNGNNLEVYVEGGRIISESSGTEYMAHGIYDVKITGSTKLLDSSGNLIAQNVVKPFQRVLIKGADHNWYDGSLGYGGSNKYTKIQILNNGEKMLSPSALKNFRHMMGTVIKQQKDENGAVQLVIQPDEGSRERRLQEQYVITQMDSAVKLQSFPVGSRVEFDYEGLNYKSSPGRIVEYYRIKPASYGSGK